MKASLNKDDLSLNNNSNSNFEITDDFITTIILYCNTLFEFEFS